MPRGACGHNEQIIMGDRHLLHVGCEGEEMESLVVDRVVDEDVLLLVYEEEVPAVAVLDKSAVRDLGLFEDHEGVVHDSEDFEP